MSDPVVFNKNKAMSKSTVTLVLRQVTIQSFSIITSVIMARLLAPKDFGLYGIISIFMQFLTLIGDGGIGASIIQQKDPPTKRILETSFTVIQISYLSTSLIAVPLALLFAHFYRSTTLSIWMIYTFIFEFYLTSFRVIPAAMLERQLNYVRLAFVETSEYFSFQAIALVLALYGKGVWSFIIGALGSRILGVILVNIMYSFTPRIRFNYLEARPMLKFGVSLQFADVLRFLQNAFIPTFVAFRMGAAAVGYLNFALKISTYPLYPLTVINRMMFPLLSRIQHDEDEFTHTFNHINKIYSFVLFGMVCILSGLLPETILLVFGAKWMVTVGLTYSGLLVTMSSGLTVLMSSAIQAKGLGKLFLITNGMNVFIWWVIGTPMVALFGFNGLIALNIARVLSFPFYVSVIRRHIKIQIWRHLWKPMLSMLGTLTVMTLVCRVDHINKIYLLILMYMVSASLYTMFYMTFDSAARRWAIRFVMSFQRVIYIKKGEMHPK